MRIHYFFSCIFNRSVTLFSNKFNIAFLALFMLWNNVFSFSSNANQFAAGFTLGFTSSDYNGWGVTCKGSTDGFIDMTITGGTLPFDISWSNGATTEDISSLPSGTYVVRVIDAIQDTVIDSVTISEPLGLEFTSIAVTNATCFSFTDGSIQLDITGGTLPYSFSWSNGGNTEDLVAIAANSYSLNLTDLNNCTLTLDTVVTEPEIIRPNFTVVDANSAPNGEVNCFPTGGNGGYSFLWSNSETTASITGLLPGSYTVTITDVEGCTTVDDTLVQNALGTCQIITDSVNNVTCFGLLNGAIYIDVIAAIPPLTYTWSNGASTQDLTGLAAGTYTVTVTDISTCNATQSFTITEPDELILSLTPASETCLATNGSVASSFTGGTGTMTYLWNTGSLASSISGLVAGTYTCTITDQNGCTDTLSTAVSSVTPPSVQIDSVTNVSCFGGANGAVYISVLNGTPSFSFQWSGSQSTEDITGLTAGTYTVTVTDGNLCTATNQAIVTEPTALNDSVQFVNTTCGQTNGSATIFPYGGTAGYTYLWNSGQTTQTINSIGIGTYTCTITDAALCTRTQSVTISAISPPVAAIDSIVNVRCNGGITGGVYISVSNGTTPYQYLWSTGAVTQDLAPVAAGTYTVTVTDANLCTSQVSGTVTQPLALNDSVQSTNPTCGLANGAITVFPYNGTGPYSYLWNTGQTTASINSLLPATYTVTVTDANLCTRIRSVTLTNISGPALVVDSVRNVRCFGGATGGVFISASGGTAPINYLWSTGAITQDLNNVIAGTYTVTATDANSCTATVTRVVTQPLSALNDSVQVVNPTCGSSNGSIAVFGFGGTAGYTYLWNTSQTTSSISSLAPGSYTVTITDANLCTRIRTSTLTNQSGPVIAVDSVRNVRCFGGATGGVFISVTGGAAPVTYLWSNGAITQDINNVIAGTYTVTATDANLCTAQVNRTITQPVLLNDSVQVVNGTCAINNGSITEFAYGGTSPYSYLWNTGATSSSISSLASGSYTVTITDANLCTRQRTSVITNSGNPVVVVDSVRNVRCNGGLTGGVFITPSAGTSPYTYQWSNGAITQDISGVAAGTYTVTVRDANLCSATQVATVTQPTVLNDSVQVTNATCGASNGSVTVFPYGGTSPYTYLWNTSAITPTISSLSAGVYTVTITDGGLCTRTRTANVSNIGAPVVAVDSVRNVRCNGGSTGGIFITVTGGVSPYTYLWSNGAITQDLNNIPAGNYTVTITDASLCQALFDTTITQPTVLNDSVQFSNPTCSLANGSITEFPFGGTGPYTYLWSNGQTTPSITSLAPGNYTVTITDANLCTKTRSVGLINLAGPVLAVDSVRNVRCFGGATGAIFITATGGSSPLSYLWSNASVSADLVNVVAGTYTVTVTDANLCTASISRLITQPVALNDSVLVTNTTCAAANGAINLFPYGGTPSYTFLWNTGATSQNLASLAVGTYTVTITDANLCTRIRSTVVGATSVPVVVIDSVRNVLCNGALTGAAYITVSGGTTPYTYLWSNTSVAQNLLNVAAGNYTVTVTDASLCTATADTSISQNSAILITTTFQDARCGLSNGSVTANPSGGTGPYTFLWNGGQTTQTITGLAAGTYTVTVRDANLCSKTATRTITAIAPPTVVVDSVRNVRCNGASTGGVFISVSGGTAAFTYLWSNGALTEDIVNVPAGAYTVTVTDANLCTAVGNANVGQSPVLDDSLVVSNANCGAPTGSATVYPYGGTPGYSVLWSNGQTTNTIFNLTAGSYTVTITDGFGCTITDVANISNTGGPVVGIDSIRNVKCNGAATGGIFITVSGGTSPYDYLWSNGFVTQDLNNVIAGTYTVTITDQNNCVVILNGTITQPSILQDSVNTTNATCGFANGSATVYPYGGTPGYNFLWSNGQTTATISNLGSGTYTVTVTDFNGCTKVSTAAINSLNGPVAFVDSVINVLCFGNNTGAIYISDSGGTAPLTYLWSNGAITQDLTGVIAGTYTVTVKDDNNCSVVTSATITQPLALNDSSAVTPEACNSANGAITIYPYGGVGPYSVLWSTGSSATTITGLVAGTYTVTITDFNNCTSSTSIIVPLSGAPSAALDSISDVSCFGNADGEIYITVTGGTLPYTYLWSNGNVTEDVTGLQAGNYSVIIADVFLCRDTAFFAVAEPDALQDSLNTNPSTCNLPNGSAKIYPYGGTSPYTYLWSNGQTSQTSINMGAGNYTVTVTDANLCTLVENVTITAIAPPVAVTDSIVDVTCNGLSDGAIYITVSSGSAPYTYLWSDGQSVEDPSGLAASTYTVTITDDDNCSIIKTYIVNEPPVLLNDSTVSVSSTCGQSNGSVTVYPSGGTGPYSYLWNNGQLTQTASNLVSGLYTVTVSDYFGCSFTASGSVNDVGGAVVTTDSTVNVSCNGGSNGAIYITLSGGTTPYSFLWSNGQVTEDITGLVAGSYSVTITDGSLCLQNQSFIITEPDLLTDSTDVVDATCGSPNGSAAVYPYGGVGPYSYLWSTGGTQSTIFNVSAGVYTVTVTDFNGCSESSNVTINNVGGPVIAVDSVVNVKCFGAATGGIYISVSNGVGPYDYLWSDFSTGQDLSGVIIGTYTVTVTDQNNCTASYSNTLTQPNEIQAVFTVNPASCNSSNGSITTTVNGGVPGYNFLWNTGALTPNISGLAAGLYTLTVTDNNNCQVQFNPAVSNISAPVITVLDSSNVTCYGAANGSITVDVTGGSTPYNYDWSNTTQNGNTITNLPGDVTYTLTITDDLGCVAIRSVLIEEPDSISILGFVPQLNGTYNVTCAGSNDGSIDLLVSGGTSPYTYLWSNFAQTDSIGNLTAGSYTVTVTDSEGCSNSASFTLAQPPVLISNAGPNKVICGINTDTLAATPPTFGSGYWLIVSGNATFADSTLYNTVITDLSNGVNVFQWVVTDGVCSAFSQVVITYNTQIQAIAGVDRDICADSVLLNATAPQFGFGYWKVVNSLGTIDDTTSAVTLATGLNPGPNVFEWVVVNGTCSDSASVIIFVNDPASCIETLELPTGFTPNRDGKNDVFFIKGLDDYPDNSIVIYNRWGNKVWEKSGYQNDWDGVNENGEPLAQGTYFVVFKVRSINKIITTYVDIRR